MKTLKVYSTPTCPYCRRLKQLLDEEGIKYQDIDVSDPGKREAMAERSGSMGVPQVEIGGKIITDYDTEEDLVDEILEIVG